MAPSWVVLAFGALLIMGVLLWALVVGVAAVGSAVVSMFRALTPTGRTERSEHRAVLAEIHATRPERDRDAARRTAVDSIGWQRLHEVPETERAAFKHVLQSEARAYWREHPDETTLPSGFADDLITQAREAAAFRRGQAEQERRQP